MRAAVPFRPAWTGKTLFRLAVFGLLAALYAVLLAKPINLTNADIGRHLKNGELFLAHLTVPEINLYSYTYPAFPTIDHHWGSGVVFFVVEQVTGFEGLSVFFIVLNLAAFCFAFDSARRLSSFSLATLASCIALPVLLSRPEVRPEAFSYLFCAVFLWLLVRYRKGEIKGRTLILLLPLLEILWVNLHIYFFLGICLVGVFLVEEGVFALIRADSHGHGKRFKELLLAIVLCTAATLLNPAFIRGAMAPLQIFQNFDYRLAENQTVWFIEGYTGFPIGLYFKIAFAALVLSWFPIIGLAAARRRHFPVAELILTVAFSLMGWLAIRNLVLFGLAAIVVTAANLKSILPKKFAQWTGHAGLIVLLLATGVSFYLLHPDFWQAEAQGTGIGLQAGNMNSLNFFAQNRLQGPIFNNYDIGGYLIYGLFPSERVFVDNRPEAYPGSFFTQTLVPMQEDENKWKQMDAQYHFNVIFFYRNDLTEWGQGFMIRRVSDPAWAPVYVDANTIIFLRRNSENAAVIRRFELPQSMFRVTRS